MHEPIQEFVDSRGLVMPIDRRGGIIRGVKILGVASQNGRTYLPEAIERAAPLYEGAKVNVNHAKRGPAGPRDYRDRIGVIRNVAARPGEGLFGDFHFNPRHALAEQLLWDAEHAPQNVGFSHNVLARLGRRGETVVVEEITKVQTSTWWPIRRQRPDCSSRPATTSWGRGPLLPRPAGSNRSRSTSFASAARHGRSPADRGRRADCGSGRRTGPSPPGRPNPRAERGFAGCWRSLACRTRRWPAPRAADRQRVVSPATDAGRRRRRSAG